MAAVPTFDTPVAPIAATRAAMADHRTPLVRNCWYVAGRSSEFGRTLRERVLLDTTVVLYRREDGTPVVMDNRCVHRSFPLSRGRLDGDVVVCGYHGMRYDPSGQCVGMPSLARAPSHARVNSYPVVEQGPLVWVWMGDRALADPSLVPAMPWLSAPDWTTVTGELPMAANYVSMHENLLDQTHFAVLHADSVGTPAYARSDLQVEEQGDQVHLTRALIDSPPPPIYGVPMKLMGRPVDRHSDSRFFSPAGHIAHASIVNRDPRLGEREVYRVNIVHVFTPERQNSIHYWWFNSRDFALDDDEASRYLQEASTKAYLEDVDALTWIQQTYDRLDGVPPELSFGPDRPGLLMRRILQRLADAEAGGRAG
jgi:vanillate O-demethylase monooxygenase subunit